MSDGERLRVSRTTRGGRKTPNHLYLQTGPAPDDADPPIGWAGDPAHVAVAVSAVNGERFTPPRVPWAALGRLIYAGPPPSGSPAGLASDWIMAVDTVRRAHGIVNAVNGGMR